MSWPPILHLYLGLQNSPKPLDWAMLRRVKGVWSTGYKRNFKLVKEILSLIGKVATSKVGSEKIIPICMVLLKEEYKALFYTVLPIHTSCQRSFFRDKKWFTDAFFRYCYPHKDRFSGYLNLVLNWTSCSISSRCCRFLVETNIPWGFVIFQAKIAFIIHYITKFFPSSGKTPDEGKNAFLRI